MWGCVVDWDASPTPGVSEYEVTWTVDGASEDPVISTDRQSTRDSIQPGSSVRVEVRAMLAGLLSEPAVVTGTAPPSVQPEPPAGIRISFVDQVGSP